MNEQKYTYRVYWSEDDEVFIAAVAEFPSLSCVGDSQIEALEGMVDLVKNVLNDYKKDGEIPPVPFGKKHYSGKMVFRITPEQHRRIAMEAAEEGISINRLMAARI